LSDDAELGKVCHPVMCDHCHEPLDDKNGYIGIGRDTFCRMCWEIVRRKWFGFDKREDEGEA
jgi:hypothetical protein